MAKLIFFDDEHKYQLDGEDVPSVSEVVRFISREVYGEVAQYSLDNASNRGTRVHKTCEALDKYGSIECDEDILPYVQAYVAFRKDKGIKTANIVDIERAFGDKELGYAGTLDRVYEMDNGERWLVDLKTSSTPQKRIWEPCLNAYKMLYEKNTGKTIDRMFDLHLTKEGKYKIIDVASDPTVFLACLALHNHMKSKRKSKNKKEEQ